VHKRQKDHGAPVTYRVAAGADRPLGSSLYAALRLQRPSSPPPRSTSPCTPAAVKPVALRCPPAERPMTSHSDATHPAFTTPIIEPYAYHALLSPCEIFHDRLQDPSHPISFTFGQSLKSVDDP